MQKHMYSIQSTSQETFCKFLHRISFWFFLSFFFLPWKIQAQEPFIELSGTIINIKNGKPVEACNVYIRNENTGTVANSEGEFVIKIPVDLIDKNLVFSNVGYEMLEIPLGNLKSRSVKIKLNPSTIIMDEVIVQDPYLLMKKAMERFTQNYPFRYQLLTAYYRELIKKNNKYVDISQGILDVFKLPYIKGGRDQIKINKGFRSKNYKHQDTLAFKLEGGPSTMFLLDVVKNPTIVLSQDVLEFYNYEITDIKKIDGKRNYEISFSPKNPKNIQLYSGKIYLENNTLAISQIEFGYPPSIVKEAGANLIKSKPKLAKLTPVKVNYLIRYREYQGRWYLYYVKNEMSIRVNWKKRLFNSTFHSVSEMVVTEREMRNPQPFDKKSRLDSDLIFSEEALKFADDSFWENYIIIKPEDDITKALSKRASKISN